MQGDGDLPERGPQQARHQHDRQEGALRGREQGARLARSGQKEAILSRNIVTDVQDPGLLRRTTARPTLRAAPCCREDNGDNYSK